MLGLLALVLGATSVLVPGQGRAETFEERALRQARERVAAVEAQLERVRGQADVAADRLREVEAEVNRLEAAVNAAADAVLQQAAAVERAAADLQRLEAEGAALEHALESQVVALFKRGSGSRFETIMGASDPAQAIQRAEFVRVLTAGERALIEGLRNHQVELTAMQERFEAERARLLAFQAEQEELLARSLAARDEAASLLQGLKRNVGVLERHADDLADDEESLRDLIARNAAAPSSATAPSTAGFIWPFCGRVTSEYGRRWGRMHKGIDIDGVTGDVLAAAKDGVVIYAAWQGGYGNLTLIDHGGGVVTGYAHQSKFFVRRGDAVVRGQRIGAMGNTGNSTGSHLHFEVRVGGSAQNPRRFLPRGC